MADRILFVEDDEPFRTTVARHLRRHGYEVIESPSVEDTRHRLDAGLRPSLVLLDLNLPTISGFTIIQDLEKNPLANHIPVIVITGEDPRPELHHAVLVMRKPCDPDYVAGIVADHLPARRNGVLERR